MQDNSTSWGRSRNRHWLCIPLRVQRKKLHHVYNGRFAKWFALVCTDHWIRNWNPAKWQLVDKSRQLPTRVSYSRWNESISHYRITMCYRISMLNDLLIHICIFFVSMKTVEIDSLPPVDSRPPSDVGESCYSNVFTGSKNCKPGLRCNSVQNSDGYSGTCVRGMFA